METKKCSKCLSVKPTSEFYKNRGQCKKCMIERTKDRWNKNKEEFNAERRKEYQKNPDKHREIKRKEYQKNSNKYKKRAKEWRKNNPDKTYLADKKRWKEGQKAMRHYLKSQEGGHCKKCGYDKNLDALDWHHKDPSTKEFNLSQIRITPKNYNIIIKEIEKCVLVCSNCHREIHYSNCVIKLSDKIIKRFAKNGINLGRENINELV
jgi:hypothetical protein